MDERGASQWVAFVGARRISAGLPADVALAARAAVQGGEQGPVLVFDDASRVVDIDYRGSADQIALRIASTTAVDPATGGDDASPSRDSSAPRGRGRPKLGVVAREVTLLPRHWEWLATQPGGTSAAVRRLVDAARQSSVQKDRVRQAKESAYRFMSTIAGNEPGFEEATRALFAGNATRFAEMTDEWPRDVRDHARALAASAMT